MPLSDSPPSRHASGLPTAITTTTYTTHSAQKAPHTSTGLDDQYDHAIGSEQVNSHPSGTAVEYDGLDASGGGGDFGGGFEDNMRRATGVRPSLDGMSRVRNGWRYRLVVMQHPERARMCGFGDKDRRPLSPSLIVKLIITDEATGTAVSPWDVNPSLFFLAADLCHPDDLMLAPRNLLVHQHATSVPSAELSGGESNVRRSSYEADASAVAGMRSSSSSSASPAGLPASAASRLPPPPHQYDASLSSADALVAVASSSSSAAASAGSLTTITMEHYTRNLVGAAVTSANVLRDEREEHCIFFVLQDLSVRTEGVYRIRLVFTDLAQRSSGDTNEGVSDALAEAYTEPFTVYSPRRFPGMLEPTELSKKLAGQGVKIAVRSDKKKRLRAGGPAASGSGAGATGGDDGEMDELDEDGE